MKKAIILIVFCVSLITPGFGQQTTDLHQVFLSAESYFLFEEFEEALPLYLRIHRAEPDNYNLFFKIGVCYLNNPYEKDKSIMYLEKASENINLKYKESNYKELGAPLDALFYLGNAYRINNNLEKARDAYKKFDSKADPAIYDHKLVVEQLAACDAAEKLMKKPLDMDVEILSNQINTRFADKNPAVSGDETRMVFISKLQFYDAVFFTERKNGEWTPPRNITPELGVDGDVYPTCLSYDGTELFIYRNDDFIGNLYTSKLVNGLWTPLVKLNDNICTKFWESHASISKDGKTLYFTSNRKGGYGGLDIYKSHKMVNGEWGPAINLGPSINSEYNEETPFITENGRKLFFSSYGHYNMGGYDVFMSVLQADSTWATPVNLGYPVNSTDDDIFFCPVKDGETAYYSVFKETGYGKHDIYRYKVYTADHPRRFDISGILNYSGQAVNGSDIIIRLISQANGDTLTVVHPDDQGKFLLNLPAGKYNMQVESDRFHQLIKSLEVSQNTPHNGINLSEQIKLIPMPVKLSKEEMDLKLQLGDTLILVSKGKPVEIKYEAEKGSVVVIKQYLDSTLVKTDTVQVDKRKQSYVFTPKPGINKIELTLTDKDGNQVSKTVTVVYAKEGDTSQVPTAITVTTETPNPANTQKSEEPQPNINGLKNELTSRADGPLKEVLKNLDLEKEGISNSSSLFNFLYENAGKLGYTSGDVDNLMAEMISKKDLAEFLSQLKNASEDPLKATISALDLKANNITSPYTAIDFLVRNANNSGYKPEDVIKALAIVGSNGNDDQKLFIEKLIHTSDEGDLKVYLKSLDLRNLVPATPQEFSIGLYRNSTGKPYTEADVLRALTNLAVSRDAETTLKKLINLADEGALKDFLTKLNLREDGIYTTEELISHIYANADLKGFTHEEVNHLLEKYLYNQVGEIDDLRQKMAALATGNFKDYLEKVNVNDYSFGSREEFIEFLKSQAGKNGYSEADVNNVLLKLAYNGNLEDIINKLTINADGNLLITLKNLDPAKEGISSFDDLIRYLLTNSDKLGYTKDDVYRMLSKYTASSDLEIFMNRLIRLADPETKTFLENVDFITNSINDRTDLVSFLLKKASEGAVNQEKMIGLLLRGTDTKIKDILPVIQLVSVGELNKVLNSGKLPIKEFNTAADLYDFLIAATVKNKEISLADINKLFSDYLVDNALNQFLGTLINHADGKLKDFLLKINLKESGINSVSGLIEYLIQNAPQNGYTENDVFKLIEKVLGRGRLNEFIANLREFASPGLARLLDQLDLEKAGISSIEDLMKYLTEHAQEFGYSMEDVWNAILRIVISGEDKTDPNDQADISKAQPGVSRVFAYGVGIFGLLGLFALLLVFIKRKKGNKGI